MLKLKVCGMRESENIRAIAQLKPQYIGFIFHPASPRYANGYLDSQLAKALPKHIQKVGVFVDAPLTDIRAKVEEYSLDLLQLHGEESPTYVEELLDLDLPIIKVFSIGNSYFDFDQLKPYLNSVSYFLFDTKGPAPGGNGISFNWSVLKNYPYFKPFFLSGGIGMDQLPALQSLDLPMLLAVDVNSKFEDRPGHKSVSTLKVFQQQLQHLNP